MLWMWREYSGDCEKYRGWCWNSYFLYNCQQVFKYYYLDENWRDFYRKVKSFSGFVENKTEDESVAEKKNNYLFFLMEIRLIFNFMQINSLLKDLYLPWKDYLTNLFITQYFLANPFELLYFVDCLISSIHFIFNQF